MNTVENYVGRDTFVEKKWKRPPHRYDLILTDIVLLNLAFLVGGITLYGSPGLDALLQRNVPLIICVNAVWIALAFHFEAYRWYERVRVELQLGRILKMIAFHFALVCIFYYQVLNNPPHNLYLWVVYVSGTTLLVSGRVFHHLRTKRKGANFRYVIVGGDENNIRNIKDGYAHSYGEHAVLAGRFGSTPYRGARNIGHYEDIIPYLKSFPNINKVIIFYARLPLETKKQIMQLCSLQMIDVEIAPRETSLFPRGYNTAQHGDMVIMTLKQEPLSLLRNNIVKRVFDVVFSFLVIVFLLSWLIPLVGLIIKRKSPGPIFFRQERSGYGNQVFRIWKFRTMHVNNDSNTVQATKNDARVFKFGEFMRRRSIDELPQFLNVFVGQMSVVGPRPHMLKHTEEYGRLIDEYMIRHKVKPGVTGWAQVNGFRGPTEQLWKMEKRVEYDVRYLENWSLPLDLRCIVKTVINAVRGDEEGAV